jgi:hypothetical protein
VIDKTPLPIKLRFFLLTASKNRAIIRRFRPLYFCRFYVAIDIGKKGTLRKSYVQRGTNKNSRIWQPAGPVILERGDIGVMGMFGSSACRDNGAL